MRRPDYHEHVSLCGGIPAYLTGAERREYDDFLRSQPEFTELRSLEEKMDTVRCAIIGGATSRTDECNHLKEECRALIENLIEKTKAWLKDVLDRDPVAATKEQREADSTNEARVQMGEDLIDIVWKHFESANVRWLTENGPKANGNDIRASMPRIFRETVGRYLQIIIDINTLREEEGNSVTLMNDNPDFNGQPNCAIECEGDWTGWVQRRFTGETIADCLRAAVEAKWEASRAVQ